ncbi:gamma-glutamyl-gamma-aminobutyrate hydrolase family protein [Streptomyces armeniacus]|uniref:Gamma-glutamyl-gamma-aminobutyrate hydrolase family protein n=1 Tax=Streptomyces armeniacus TaxID=83291 RepID=A0A345XJM5_9ACTN|nr:gamma-glutamyl-gamma-aminobutyrate hydrolase family protein [Streptomyces armeniacus]AXK31841.1 gamma-glutamyl-gamma-aminobutyrate hydrolase family protein [Streptomyces armeniacus]
MKPRIGITSRFRTSVQSHCIHQGYIDHVVRAGGLPVVIPCTDDALCEPYLSLVDGIMLTGGEDIDPAHCTGTTRQTGYAYQPVRDRFELRLTKAALESGTPVLGICRGCQILYAATDGPLLPHIPDVNGGVVTHRVSVTETSRHYVNLAEDGRVALAYGKQAVEVTSYHHQGLAEQEPGASPWRVTARSDDSLIEALELPGSAWVVGVLWHPELPADADGGEPDPLISAFVAAAAGTS